VVLLLGIAGVSVGMFRFVRWRQGQFVVDERYPTFSTAVKASAATRSWLPGFVPGSATDVRLVHNLDTNQEAGSFTFPISEGSKIRSKLNALTGGCDFWISEEARRLLGSIQGGTSPCAVLRDQSMEVFTAPVLNAEPLAKLYVVGVDWRAGRGLYWSSP
jgi:hypothetical protein